MIPKIIHYCWFGGEKPQEVKIFIDGWRKLCPDYEIIEWNERTFDINCCAYVREAYECRRFAFVSDVARLKALYEFGGIYLDTDVEVLKNLNRFLTHKAFVGFENDNFLSTAIIGCEKNNVWIANCLKYYENKHFLEAGIQNLRTNVDIITEITVSMGLKLNNTFQEISGLLSIYPKDVFSPKSWQDGRIYKTKDTVCIHHFKASWFMDAERERNSRRLKLVRKLQRREFFEKCITRIKSIIKRYIQI